MTQIPLNPRERLVQLLLRLIGLAVITAIIPMLFPRQWIEYLYNLTGLKEWPDQPISWYFARSLSLMYFAHGVMVLGLSTDVRRYWSLIQLLGWLNLAIGILLTVIDLVNDMPMWWTIIEGPSVIVGGCLLLWLMLPAGVNREPEN